MDGPWRVLLGHQPPAVVEQEVREDRGDGHGADPGVEDDLEPGRELVVELGHGDRDDAHPEAAATTTRLALPSYSTLLRVRMPLAATVPNRTSPAPPRTGSGTTATTAPDSDDEAALDAGDGHRGGEHVGLEAASDVAAGQLLVDHLADGQDVGRRLGHDHQHHDEHGDDRADEERRRPEVERRAELEQGRVAEPGEVGGAERDRHQGAEHQPEQDRHPAEEPGRNRQMSMMMSRVAAARPTLRTDPNSGEFAAPRAQWTAPGEQGRNDHRDHGPGDDRGEEPQQAGEERGDGQADRPATMRAPKMARGPASPPPRVVPMASMVETAANEVPCTMGRRAPSRHTPR